MITAVNTVSPKEFGLPSGTILEDNGQGGVILVINRKSRLIMADGRKIVAKLQKVRKARPGAIVAIRTTAPVCGKTRLYLEENNIGVI